VVIQVVGQECALLNSETRHYLPFLGSNIERSPWIKSNDKFYKKSCAIDVFLKTDAKHHKLEHNKYRFLD
jgi:hypothetical protein